MGKLNRKHKNLKRLLSVYNSKQDKKKGAEVDCMQKEPKLILILKLQR